jgi:hypothetical protein
MLSEMSYGYSLGMSEPDNWKSKIYNGSTSATVTTKLGNGTTNNRPYVSRASFIGASRNNVTSTGPNMKIISILLLLSVKDI